VRSAQGSGKSERAHARDALAASYASQLFPGELPGGASEAELRKTIEAGAFSDDDRRELRLEFERSIAESFRGQGNDPRRFRPQIQSLARKMLTLFIDEGNSIEEIQKMLIDGRLRP
jgi:hypothetical protein